jgi:hypothetical protein
MFPQKYAICKQYEGTKEINCQLINQFGQFLSGVSIYLNMAYISLVEAHFSRPLPFYNYLAQ